ncbi:mobilization protein [Chitinophaga barathri]|nr:mobilization protein [Chitinophaga barathri]
MGRKKKEEGRHLRNIVKTRINDEHFQRLTGLLNQSHHRSMSELVRTILCEQKVTIFTVDGSLDLVMEELVRIRRELQAIGQNVNQTTRVFHSTAGTAARMERLQEVATAYREVGMKTDALLSIIAQFSKQWLQK